MWKFEIKQNGIMVARGEHFDSKEDCLIEANHYLALYEEEDFTKMTLKIERK